ncbi:MAG: hypothetical protein ACLQVK_21785 [Acidimicrobiales bacterium]
MKRALAAMTALAMPCVAVPCVAVPVFTPYASAASVPAEAAACSLPLVHDIYDGFHVGVPRGWDLSTLGGQVAVGPSPSSPEGVELYGALLTKGVTPAAAFSAFMRYEQGLVRKSGSVFNYQVQAGGRGLPAASVEAEVSGVQLAGEANVRALSLPTQLASSEALVSLAYGPRAQFAAEAPTLDAIGRCYGPERATLFEVYHQPPVAPFSFIEPPGWHIGAEGQDDLSLDNAANTASATFDLWGPLVQGVNVSQPVSTPSQAITYWFAKLGFQAPQVLSATDVGASQEYMEFTATLNGKALHGLIYMDTSTGGGSTAGVFRLALADSALWDPLNGALIEMAGSIQHDFRQDLQEIQAVNRQWQDFSGQVANFDDTLNDQQLVQDPSTGQLYEAPYSSYLSTGPQGPGYYLPDGQELNPVERP